MRLAPNDKIEKYRVMTMQASADAAGTNSGAFMIGALRVISCDGGGWDHVSVSRESSLPTWDEMCVIKNLFFRGDEVVMQLHPAKANYVNCHKFCLHLWRPQTQPERDEVLRRFGADSDQFPREAPGPIPLPPKEMVG